MNRKYELIKAAQKFTKELTEASFLKLVTVNKGTYCFSTGCTECIFHNTDIHMSPDIVTAGRCCFFRECYDDYKQNCGHFSESLMTRGLLICLEFLTIYKIPPLKMRIKQWFKESVKGPGWPPVIALIMIVLIICIMQLNYD